MSSLRPEGPFPDVPISAVEDKLGVVQTIPLSSVVSSYATSQAPAAAEEQHSALDGRPLPMATQGVLNPSGEVMPGVGEPTSNAARSTNAFDGAPAEDIVTYGRISFEGLCDFFLAL